MAACSSNSRFASVLKWLARSFADGSALPFVLLAAFLTFHACTITPRILNTRPLPFDTYRDVACARSILNGQGVFSDPTIEGEYGWYSPLNPLFFAALSKISGVDVFLLYSYSPLFINIFTPILFYLLVYLLLGHWQAFTATLLIPVVPWLKTHVLIMGMPSVHAIPLILLVLLATVGFERRGMGVKHSIALGILMGIAMLHHSLSGVIAYTAVCLMLALRLLMNRGHRRYMPLVLAIVIPILIAAPYLVPNLLRPKLNPTPLLFIAPEFCSTAYALFIPNPIFAGFFWSFMIIGLIALRHRIMQPPVLLVFCILAVTAGGQLLGYARLLATNHPDAFGFLGHLPCALPHEFQWFFQLFALIPVACGIATCAKAVLRRRHIVLDIALPLLLIIPGYVDLPKTQLSGLVLHLSTKPAYIQWIEENTRKDAVFVTSHTWHGYREVQPYTARRILYHYPAHMNFNVDVVRRGDQKGRLLYHADKVEADAIIAEFNLDYVLLDRSRIPADRLAFFDATYGTVYRDAVFSIHRFNQPPPRSHPLLPNN